MTTDDDSAGSSRDRVHVPAHGRGQLVPFDSERGKAAARKSVEVRAAKRAAGVTSASEAAVKLDELARTFQRDRLGEYAAASAAFIMGELCAGRIKLKSGEDAAALLRALVDVARLEAGEATSVHLSAHVSAGDAAARLAAIRARAASLVLDADTVPASAAAVAVADADDEPDA